MLNKNSFDNKNISIHFRDRDDFLQEFKKQSSYKNGSFISTPKMIYPMGKRWNYLHDLNKLYQSKIQEKREQQRLLTEEKEMKECTFVPHLNKNISYIINNSKSANINENSKVTNKGNNNSSSFLNLNLIQRQTEWIKKKKSDIKEFENRKNRYEMEECFFSPEINGENAINKAKLKRKTISLLEDPESYSMYLKRLKKKREQVEKDKKKERLKPGNGNVWKKRYYVWNSTDSVVEWLDISHDGKPVTPLSQFGNKLKIQNVYACYLSPEDRKVAVPGVGDVVSRKSNLDQRMTDLLKVLTEKYKKNGKQKCTIKVTVYEGERNRVSGGQFYGTKEAKRFWKERSPYNKEGARKWWEE